MKYAFVFSIGKEKLEGDLLIKQKIERIEKLEKLVRALNERDAKEKSATD